MASGVVGGVVDTDVPAVHALASFGIVRAVLSLGFEFSNPTAQESLNVVMNKGRTLGYSGQKLVNYVARELARDPEALRHGHDAEAIDYVRDVLYKRAFSGEGFASNTAQRYEDCFCLTLSTSALIRP
ncbi:hypothetical protein QK428_15640 [Pseudomonas aeruginosa]|nr:hypothetical protein [Pseudomonas aeruginosa]